MNRDQKAAVIEEIAADISESQAIFAVDYRGITVAQADQLRASLRSADAVFRVVKNSLTERAATQAGAEQLLPLLEGPTALTFVRGDAAAAAKVVADFTRVTQLLAFKGGVMDGAALSPAEVTTISRLPSRDVLYGQLVGLIATPLSGLARTLNALIGGLAVGLGGVLAKKESGEVPAGEAPAAAAVEAPAEEEASAAEDASAETPAAQEAAVAEPATDEPAAEEAPAEEPTGEEPAAEEASGDAVGDEAIGGEPAGVPETPADADEPIVQEGGPDKDSGDALETTTTDAADGAGDEAGPTADANDGAAPEAPSGDNEEDQ